MKATAIIAAGGAGARFQSNTPKQFLPLGDVPLIVHTLRAFELALTVDRVVVVLPRAHLPRLNEDERQRHELAKIVSVVPGGNSRQESVQNGLETIDWSPSYVAIHDAARCLVTPALINRTVDACQGWDGAIAALPVGDTLKRVSDSTIVGTQSREGLWGMQTPQVFRFPFILEAYREAKTKGMTATDDASVAESAKGRVRVVEGSTRNFKITFPDELKLAERLLGDSR